MGWQAAGGSILYPESDPDARLLAERIAADLSLGRDRRVAEAAAVSRTREEFLASVLRGTEFAYLFPLERNDPERGLAVRELTARAPWLVRGLEEGMGSAPSPPTESIDPHEIAERLVRAGLVVPLVLTRPQLVYRHGLAGGSLNGAGLPELERMGWRERSGEP
jgi:hypothetical protein